MADGMAVRKVGQVVVTREHAVLAPHYARHQFAVSIVVSHALCVYDMLRRG